MNSRSIQIAAEVMMGMAKAIRDNNEEEFVAHIKDRRINNCIVGNKQMETDYANLCMNGLRHFWGREIVPSERDHAIDWTAALDVCHELNRLLRDENAKLKAESEVNDGTH